MGRFNVKLSYIANYIVEVDAEDEGEALAKAREMAEEADFNQFHLGVEREATCNYCGEP